MLMPAPSPLTEGEINDLLESKPVSYMKAQGCSDEVGACVSDPVCSHELKAAATLPEDGSAEKPTGGGELLTKLITCGDVAMKKQKDDDQKLMKEVFEKYPSYEKAGKAYGKAKEAENLVQRRFDHRTQKTPTEFLMKSAIAHLNALEAIKALTPVEEVEPREKQIGGSGGSLEPPGPLLTHLHTVYMAYSECLPTRLNPLAERACFT
jgi:hypothetical protein